MEFVYKQFNKIKLREDKLMCNNELINKQNTNQFKS